jgi:Flp pilus assembly pilin Flp
MDMKTPKHPALARFLENESGEYATEFIMILTFVILPIISAVFLLQDVLKEYVAFGQVFISSPFF